MPAGLPGDTLANNLANPSAGAFILYSLLSGPKGSPLDGDKDSTTGNARGGTSTGGLSTGIGFGANVMQSSQIGLGSGFNFQDDYTPGLTTPSNTPATNSTIMYIGGGKSTANVGGVAPNVPYTAGWGIGGAGNGGSRDGGAGPAFTGFPTKLVTAVGAVANGAVVETGFTNRTGIALVATQSVFGSATAASAAVA